MERIGSIRVEEEGIVALMSLMIVVYSGLNVCVS